MFDEGRDGVVGQVVDDVVGAAVTKREYDIATVPAGKELVGAVVDFLARPAGSQGQLGGDVQVPLFNVQPDMESREQINEALTTGVKVWCVRPPDCCASTAVCWAVAESAPVRRCTDMCTTYLRSICHQ